MYTQNPILYPKQNKTNIKLDDIDIGLTVRYIGEQVSSTITVSSDGDITFKHGASGAEVVDATIDSGGDDEGVIDVSDANADTFGEVVDLINASVNWEAYLVGTLRSDDANASTGSLLVRSESTLLPNVDLKLFKDTSKVLNISLRIGSRINSQGTEIKSAAELYEIVSTNTFSTGTNLIQVYRINEETNEEEKIYEIAGAATTVQQILEFVVNNRGSLSVNKQDEHLLIRMIGSTECTGQLQVIGAVAKGL